MAYLRCPECRLTAPAHAYYLRGDQCPRCLTAMEPCARFREATAVAKAATAAAPHLLQRSVPKMRSPASPRPGRM
jgi:hypothetical protein